MILLPIFDRSTCLAEGWFGQLSGQPPCGIFAVVGYATAPVVLSSSVKILYLCYL